MRALILCAGRGERLRPLTDHTPKPLLQVRGKALVQWHIEALAAAGVRDIVINTAWLEAQFPTQLGDGARFGVRLHFAHEQAQFGGALETAGGIANALPLLRDETDEANAPFWVVSGDVFLPGFSFPQDAAQAFAQGQDLAQLWLVNNAPHHPQGDFAIDATGHAALNGPAKLTWASVGLFKPALFDGITPGTRLPLRPCLEAGIAQGRIAAEHWPGHWTDVGTVERLNQLNDPALKA